METLKGVIENVVDRNESNDYTVIEIADEENALITAVGIMPMAFEGENVILRGSWTFHKEFGKQFSFEAYEKTLPREVDGILQYLSSATVKGVGPVTALKIVNRFGVDSFDVIENHPEWLADIPGITLKKAAIISESFREQTGIRGVMMFCKDYVGAAEITRVYKKLGSGAVGIIKENPYILCDGDYGIAFDKIDALAKTVDFPASSPVRILAASKYVLNYNATSNGHTALPYGKLVGAVANLTELSENDVASMTEEFISTEQLRVLNIPAGRFVMTCEVYDAEKYIANRLYELDRDVARVRGADVTLMIEKLETDLGIEYATLQRKAIYDALDCGVMILTGGPGTGKTTVVKALLAIFKSLGINCALAAPTGRAAKRMSEATSAEAKTIHRMLEMERTGDMKTKFGRNAQNPLDERAIIIDEASMIDLTLTEALLSAVRNGTRIIFIGDADQLASVGAGNIFSDMINSGEIKTVRLTEIFRQSKESLIITNAHRINSGEMPQLNVTDNDFFFVRRDYERDIAKTVASLITKRLPKAYGKRIAEDIQVIAPSKKGFGGVEALNAVLQAEINPPAACKKEKSAHGVIFREGDRVMQTVNNYDVEWERDGREGMGIFNGDIGVIESINNLKSHMTVRFDDRVVNYSFDLLDELELAYAITVHKSQGSEYPVIILPVYHCAPMLMTRNLLYTAVTRARRMVILVGRADVVGKMVENDRVDLRYTTLREQICHSYQ